MNREKALAIVNKYIENPNLLRHMLAVEAAMKFYGERLEPENVDIWRLVGLLHDFDWEIHPTLDQHPQDGTAILKENGVPEEVRQAILSHADHTGVPRNTLMRKALFACDEITGLITACVLVRPSRSIHDLKVKSVRKKWKDRSFAAGANREEIAHGAEEFGVELWEHVGNVIEAMKREATELGLDGNIV